MRESQARIEAEHVENAINIPLDTINSNFACRSKKLRDFYLHCLGGYRSVIMASILKSRGFHRLINVEKGIVGIRKPMELHPICLSIDNQK